MPRTIPILYNGALQYFADVRQGDLSLALVNSASVPETEGGSSSGEAHPLGPISHADAAAASIKGDAA